MTGPMLVVQNQTDPLERSRVVLARNDRCPFCGGKDTEGHSVDTGKGWARQGMQCNSEKCAKTWTDEYTLTQVIAHD